jgi:glycosyltransferase involved in cell wall biosynthesis
VISPTLAISPTLWLVVPAGIDEIARVSGGNAYDRRVSDGLTARGWDVRECAVADGPGVARALDGVPADGLVLIDGLVAGWAAAAVDTATRRCRIVVLVHLVVAAFPGATDAGVADERRVLSCARLAIATSPWSARELTRHRLVGSERLAVVVPGADDRASARPGRADLPRDAATGTALLCVGAVARHKGQDVLLDALAALPPRLNWHCTIAGSCRVDPEYASRVRARAARLHDRVRMPGVLDRDALDRAYRGADLLVAPSRAETYGMAIGDALACGVPVLATTAGGIPDAVHPGAATPYRTGRGAHAGVVLVPPGDVRSLRDMLRRWMTDPGLRARLGCGAARRRGTMPRWHDTVGSVDALLRSVS